MTRPLKRSKTGLETEFHLIDNEGRIANRAAEVIETLKSEHEGIDVTHEIGQNMIEFGCYPDVQTYNPTRHIIRSIQKAADVCMSKGLQIYPFATYPGSFEPRFTPQDKYVMKQKIFGFPRIEHACRATGFHHHYSLPKGVFDTSRKMVRLLKKSKLEHSMVSSYNFEIAADPILTLLAQSSPFYQGSLLGKDSRVIVYRGGAKLHYKSGLYGRLQQLGGLPPYKQTATDLLSSLGRRWKRWKQEVRRADAAANFDELYPYKLDIGWNPVKLNKHGTLEQRGMDINSMSIVVALTVVLKFCLKQIQREFLEVIPADFAMSEPFKLEDNNIYIPPHSYLRSNLQLWSAYSGYEQENMHYYAKRFLWLARNFTPKSYSSIIRPLYSMVEDKKSVSDRVVAYARRKGYISDGKISNDDAAELALYYANQFPKDLERTAQMLDKIAML